MGAGLGGGSANGAHTLRLLNELFDLKLTAEVLCQYALTLGSDCAFFIHDKPLLGSGRGEILSPATVSLSGKFLVIIKPDIHIATREAYAGVTPAMPSIDLEKLLAQHDISEWKGKLINDFEASVFTRHPAIAAIKNFLYAQGALYASMSGSGAAVFGIFEKPIASADWFPEAVQWCGQLP